MAVRIKSGQEITPRVVGLIKDSLKESYPTLTVPIVQQEINKLLAAPNDKELGVIAMLAKGILEEHGFIEEYTDIEAITKAFLRYSFEDIHYEYDGLTLTEKQICSRMEFVDLVKWIKGE